MSELESFLRDKAQMKIQEYTNDVISPFTLYNEKPEENDEDTYIQNVGVLAVIDGNKRDFANYFIGYDRGDGDCRFVGELDFSEGENTDMEVTLRKIGKCLKKCW